MSHFIGIDVSKATLDCAWLRDPDQDKAKRKGCQNEPRSFESLITWAEASSGILSKNDVIDAVLLVRYGLMARKLIAYVPAPQEVNDLRSLLNRLDVLERNCRKELNRLEKAGKSATFHRLEQQSIRRSVKRHETEIATFRNAARQCINASPWR